MERDDKNDGGLFLKGKLLCEQNNKKKFIYKKKCKQYEHFLNFENLKVIKCTIFSIVMRWAIWYHLYKLKSMKNTH